MSQVTFKATYKGEPVEVMAGWDRPLQHYYLTVFDLRDDAPRETVWDTIDHFDASDERSTIRLRWQLKTMEIAVPMEFWARVELQEENVRHAFDGERWSR
jgi:hypothetical protein